MEKSLLALPPPSREVIASSVTDNIMHVLQGEVEISVLYNKYDEHGQPWERN